MSDRELTSRKRRADQEARVEFRLSTARQVCGEFGLVPEHWAEWDEDERFTRLSPENQRRAMSAAQMAADAYSRGDEQQDAFDLGGAVQEETTKEKVQGRGGKTTSVVYKIRNAYLQQFADQYQKRNPDSTSKNRVAKWIRGKIEDDLETFSFLKYEDEDLIPLFSGRMDAKGEREVMSVRSIAVVIKI